MKYIRWLYIQERIGITHKYCYFGVDTYTIDLNLNQGMLVVAKELAYIRNADTNGDR